MDIKERNKKVHHVKVYIIIVFLKKALDQIPSLAAEGRQVDGGSSLKSWAVLGPVVGLFLTSRNLEWGIWVCFFPFPEGRLSIKVKG